MPLQRSPTDQNLLKTPPIVHYGSDPAINTLTNADTNSLLKISKRQKRTLDGYPGHSALGIGEIKSMFAELKDQQDQKFESISNAMSLIISQNQVIQQTMENMNSQYEELLSKTKCLEKENKECKNLISTLEAKVELLEKKARCSSLEIRNIPKQDTENKEQLMKIVQNIGKEVNLEEPIGKNEFRELYRTKKGCIIVDFTTVTRKEEIFSKYKSFQKDKRLNNGLSLNTAQIGLSGPSSNIYVSESLTHKASHLYFLARDGVKNKKIFAAWVSYGRIYIKKKEGSASTCITSEEQLNTIFSQ